MTRNEAKEILRKHNAWRRGKDVEMYDPKVLGLAIDRMIEPNQYAQEMRDAALNWPSFVSDVSCSILYAFCSQAITFEMSFEYCKFQRGLNEDNNSENNIKSRMFLLLVAEALED
jgi:hypothetical protein